MARVSKRDIQLVRDTWDRYEDALVRGHAEFQLRAERNEDFYSGDGRQWQEDIKAQLAEEGRPWLESNIVFSTVNTVLGYQTQTRMDIAYKPREIDDQDLADVLSKLSMYILDANDYPWIESQVFADGMIMSRGFFDIRVTFDENMYGELTISSKDPMDIVIDIDANSYDPDDWADVIETKWLTLEEIESLYGQAKRREVERYVPQNESDWGDSDIGARRTSFGGKDHKGIKSYIHVENAPIRARVLERQWWKLSRREFFMDPTTGDLQTVPDEMDDKQKRSVADENDYEIIDRVVKRVRWTVSTYDVLLHDDWSPYDHFTIVPYFPYFRRGRTLGIVDNLISVQEMFNKTLSQALHVVNTTANSGWIVQENSLTNMDTEDLEDMGAATGLVLEYKAGFEAPEKILHNQVPTGLFELANVANRLINEISGVSEVFRGEQSNEITGVAIQNRVQQNAVQLAGPIDNLFRTRHMLSRRLLKLIQQFYTEERTFVITDVDEVGEEQPQQVEVNKYDEEVGEFLNDVTQGRYDVIITDVPNQVTFQNSQFMQAIELRKFGVNIPDDVVIMYSGLSKKNELAKRIRNMPSEEADAREAEQNREMAETQATVDKSAADASNKRVEALEKAVEIAQILSQNPEVAAVAQELLGGMGFMSEPPRFNQQEAQGNAAAQPPQAPQRPGLGQGGTQ